MSNKPAIRNLNSLGSVMGAVVHEWFKAQFYWILLAAATVFFLLYRLGS